MVAREDDAAREVGARVRLSVGAPGPPPPAPPRGPRSRLSHLECARCGRELSAETLQQRCSCGGALFARYDLSRRLDLSSVRARAKGLWRFGELLPPVAQPVSLGEVESPLVFCPALSHSWGADIYLKDDSHLPSETFKARGAAIALGRAVEFGVAEIVMPSAGNAGAAWSLYAARAGVSLTVVLAKSAPLFNQLEIEVAGAELELVDGTIADAGRRAREIARDRGAFLAATFSEPYRVEGKKTCWLEVFDALGSRDAMRLPDTIVLPVGGGVAAVAAAKAVGEVTALAWAGAGRPKIIGVQPARCAPLVRAFERGDSEARPWPEDPTTVAAGLRVPAPAEGTLVLDVVRRSGGAMIAVTDDEIVAAMRAVASREGVFPCPEGAAAFAATARLASKGALQGPVVVYNTGAGTKYVDELARFRLL